MAKTRFTSNIIAKDSAKLNGSNEGGSTPTPGTTDYTELSNKPSINNITLNGNKTTDDLGIKEPEIEVLNYAQGTLPSGNSIINTIRYLHGSAIDSIQFNVGQYYSKELVFVPTDGDDGQVLLNQDGIPKWGNIPTSKGGFTPVYATHGGIQYPYYYHWDDEDEEWTITTDKDSITLEGFKFFKIGKFEFNDYEQVAIDGKVLLVTMKKSTSTGNVIKNTSVVPFKIIPIETNGRVDYTIYTPCRVNNYTNTYFICRAENLNLDENQISSATSIDVSLIQNLIPIGDELGVAYDFQYDQSSNITAINIYATEPYYAPYVGNTDQTLDIEGDHVAMTMTLDFIAFGK